ncbi:hypothetical protein M2347_001949 [Chryseobacterium sp. H1D6B]|uniref:hypothetical protein n=1 Tax=Chryseobacterium sp. H1D6B TaxID=2940588 RepID=UPI0015CD73F9|nr:hypothetical protein [Chryseobacterium sp. H1D6B]MDH6252222.1 hypothetical protein [Chryseobacterium sp. H1D6B]
MRKHLFIIGVLVANIVSAQLFTANGTIAGATTNTATGNVGIGITTPESKLSIYNNGGVGSNQLQLTTAHNRNPDRYFMKNTVYGTGSEDVTFFLKHDGQMYVDGNVGIGTQVPQAKLEVKGDFRAGAGNNYLFYNGAADIILRYLDRGQGGRAIVHDTGNILALNYQNDFTGGTKIGSSFFVNDTNASLQGKFEAKEIKVTLTPTADFVFEENYTLPKLDEVEKHIKEKKHLPEIASAKEMKKEGVNIGEFQIKLLQKIEELTLYMIEQNKQIKEDKAAIKIQSEKITLLENQLKELKTKNK